MLRKSSKFIENNKAKSVHHIHSSAFNGLRLGCFILKPFCFETVRINKLKVTAVFT